MNGQYVENILNTFPETQNKTYKVKHGYCIADIIAFAYFTELLSDEAN